MLKINDIQLKALHRYLFESKFSDYSIEIAYSRMYSEIANEVLDTIIDNCKSNPEEYEGAKLETFN